MDKGADMNAAVRNADTVFAQAIEIASAEERADFLERACANDPELRREVDKLVRDHFRAGQFLERPAAHIVAAVDEAPTERPGTMIGPYKVVEPIGEGGMGTVWMAQQTEPVRRLVAVKLIKAGMDSAQVLARFEAERQALALMDHPNIARVLDAGTTSAGRPYFVMDLVKGVPITRYCDEHHLTPRQRLELFVPVCSAVQHAHQKGVIHRDLKPSNVLVAPYDGQPVPKVIDFGVAKAAGQTLTDKTLVTGFGAIVGTLEYMSPEQAEVNQLDIDTRSDVYALGVLLYELLAGSPPFTRQESEQGGLLEMLRAIREQEPTKPSAKLSTAEGLPTLAANRGTEPAKLTRLVRGELDWIVMKALEKDRNRRYETANGFAADVQRYLADEPVLACPPSAGYRLRKFVRRNRGPVIAASTILLCLLAGIIGTTAGLVWAMRERDKKADALLAQTRASEAEVQARDKALAALREMTDEFVQNQMARDTQLTEENKAFLRRIIEHFEGLAAVTAHDAKSRAIRAEGHFRVGLMRHRLGEFKEAEAAFAAALALLKQLAGEFPNQAEFRRVLAASHNGRGILLRDLRRLTEAEADFRDALAIRKQLAGEFLDQPEFRRDLAASHNNLGAVFHAMRRLKEAEPAFAEALALYKQLAGEFPDRLQFRRELAMSHNGLGAVFHETGRPKEAEAAYKDALAIRKELAREYPGRPELRHDLSRSHYNLGTLFQATRRLKEAEAAYGDALALQQALAREFPNWPELRQDLSRSHYNLGAVFDATGRLKEAEVALADALTLFRQLACDFPNEPQREYLVAGTCVSLADYRLGQRDFKGAKAYLDDAVPHQEAALKASPQNPDYRRCCRSYLTTLIQTDAGLGDQAGARRAAEQLRDLGWEPPATAYDAGCALALCIPVVQKDDQLDAAKRQAAVKFYGDQALAMLRAAVAKDYKGAGHMKQDKNLDALRERDDFKKLLAQLEAREK